MLHSEERDQHRCRNSKKSLLSHNNSKSCLWSSVSSQLHWSEETGRTVLSFLDHWTGWSAGWRDWRPLLVGQLAFNQIDTLYNWLLIIIKWQCRNRWSEFRFFKTRVKELWSSFWIFKNCRKQRYSKFSCTANCLFLQLQKFRVDRPSSPVLLDCFDWIYSTCYLKNVFKKSVIVFFFPNVWQIHLRSYF